MWTVLAIIRLLSYNVSSAGRIHFCDGCHCERPNENFHKNARYFVELARENTKSLIRCRRREGCPGPWTAAVIHHFA